MGFPRPEEAAPYYFKYMNRIQTDNVVGVLQSQFDETVAFLSGITEEQSLHRYAPDKWSVRQVLSHVNDAERVFLFRAFWFGRGFESPLPSFDEKISASAARADDLSWASHVAEFKGTRLSTLTFFFNLSSEAWTRRGVASGYPFTVNATAYIIAGHLAHHVAILQERYL
ncbi:MAG: DinB family protein [Acidobacteriota bacterium]